MHLSPFCAFLAKVGGHVSSLLIELQSFIAVYTILEIDL